MVAQILYAMPCGRLAKEQAYVSMREIAVSMIVVLAVLELRAYRYCAS